MSEGADELVLFADNDEPLYRQSFKPIVENLRKKVAKGKYDPTLARKLWRYHADRAAQKYAKEHGSPGHAWHKMFSTADRNEAAAHWEQYARREYLGIASHDRTRARRRSAKAPARKRVATRRDASRSPAKVYLLKGSAWNKSTWRPGYYLVVGQTTKAGMMLQDEDRASRSGELAYALAKSPRGGALWFLARNTRSVRSRAHR